MKIINDKKLYPFKKKAKHHIYLYILKKDGGNLLLHSVKCFYYHRQYEKNGELN